MLEGQAFTIYSDQKPLIDVFQQHREKASPPLLRHLDFIRQFITTIKHIAGKENIVADACSELVLFSFLQVFQLMKLLNFSV